MAAAFRQCRRAPVRTRATRRAVALGLVATALLPFAGAAAERKPPKGQNLVGLLLTATPGMRDGRFRKT